MGKVKAWAYDCAEQEVDSILDKVKSGVISKDDAEKEIMQVSNLDILGVDEYNVDDLKGVQRQRWTTDEDTKMRMP